MSKSSFFFSEQREKADQAYIEKENVIRIEIERIETKGRKIEKIVIKINQTEKKRIRKTETETENAKGGIALTEK